MSKRSRAPKYGSDIVVDLLNTYGVDYVAANIGSTFRSVWDSIVNYGRDTAPKSIAVCHEEIGVALAHGYAKAAGKPMAVVLHDLVGLQHAIMAIYNAWCDRVPIILLDVEGPLDTTKRRPWIDYVHTANIPNTAVRDFVKWDDLPYSIKGVPEAFVRARNAAVTKPKAPVFICLDTGYCEGELTEKVTIPDPKANPPPSQIGGDEDSLRKAAKLVLDSDCPFIIAGSTGRNPGSVGKLVELAETGAFGVFDQGEYFNFPNTHPLDITDAEAFKEADTLLILDAPFFQRAFTKVNQVTRTLERSLRPDARVVQVGLESTLFRPWSGEVQSLVPLELSVVADSALAIPQLTKFCSQLIRQDARRKKVRDRFAKIKALHEAGKKRWQEEARRQWNEVPISLPRLAGEVWPLIKGTRWVLANGALQGWVRRVWDWEEEGCFLGGSGGAGLGYGLPASLGAALALKATNKLVIDFQSDGDLLYTASSFWTAAHHNLPVFIVMYNNRAYYNDAIQNRLTAEDRGRDAKAAFNVGGVIASPFVDFAKLAQSQGVHGEGPVERPEDLSSALARVLKITKQDKRPALLDVITKYR